MTTQPSVQDAHDSLLRDFPEMAHEVTKCGICMSTEKAEEAAVSDDRTFTSVEHAAILETEVARQTAELRVAKEDLEAEKAAATEMAEALAAEKAELLTKVDLLEAQKAAETLRADTAEQTHTDYLAEQQRAAELETLKVERTEAVKAALDGIDEAYFTADRIARWAEMSAEAFDTVLADLTETAGAFKPKGKTDPAEPDEDDKKEKARETAAFRGGAEPTSEGAPSAVASVLSFGRRSPAKTA